VIDMKREHNEQEVQEVQALLEAAAKIMNKQVSQCAECESFFIVLHAQQRYCSSRCRRRRAMREYFRRRRERERVEMS
jgi:hypothetical protein